MSTYTFEIPEEVEKFIKDELNIEPATYLQNELVNPIIKKFEGSVRTKEVAKAEEKVTTDVAEAKVKMKIEKTKAVEEVKESVKTEK